MTKVNFKTLAIAACVSLTAFSSCVKDDPNNGNTNNSSTRSASFKVNGAATTVEKPYDGIFDDNGTISNSVDLKAKNGTRIQFDFDGSAPATYQLKAYPDAVYTDSAGNKYNASSGELKVSEYTVDGVTHKFSATFSFIAKSISNNKDSVVITDGVITNCSNEF